MSQCTPMHRLRCRPRACRLGSRSAERRHRGRRNRKGRCGIWFRGTFFVPFLPFEGPLELKRTFSASCPRLCLSPPPHVLPRCQMKTDVMRWHAVENYTAKVLEGLSGRTHTRSLLFNTELVHVFLALDRVLMVRPQHTLPALQAFAQQRCSRRALLHDFQKCRQVPHAAQRVRVA